MNSLFRLLYRFPKPVVFATIGALGAVLAAFPSEVLVALLRPSAAAASRDEGSRAVDVVFVLDVTGSMGDELQGVITGIGSFVEELGAQRLDYRIGLIAYGDRYENEPEQRLSFPGGAFTSDPAEFGRTLGSQVRLVHGGDDPESSFAALHSAAGLTYREGAVHVVILITDAPPHRVDAGKETVGTAAAELARRRVNQVHLVIPPPLLPMFAELQQACPGEVFDLNAVAHGGAGFASALKTIGNRVAEQTVRSLVASEQFSSGAGWRLYLMAVVWALMLAAGVYFALLVGQNAYLRRPLMHGVMSTPSFKRVVTAGVTAGVTSQFLVASVGSRGGFALLAQIAGWGVLGFIVGRGLAAALPNLPRLKAGWAGLLGGVVGAAGFLLTSFVVAENAGRVLGAAVLGAAIGAVLALAEQWAREGSLIIHWGPNESSIMSLGPDPIRLGSARDAHVYLSGYPAQVGAFWLRQGVVTFHNGQDNKEHPLRNGSQVQFGKIHIEVRTS